MKVTIQDSRTSVTVEPRDFRVTVSGARGPAGIGIAAGGAEGQILAKASATDYDTEWIDNYAINVEVYVKNSSGSPMTKGQVVYISGADGTNPTISLAIATTEMGSSKTIGWLKQDLAQGDLGYVITEGLLEGINTNSAGAAGDPIWLSPTTAGGVVYGIANKPSAPNHLVFLGYVLRKNINNGKVYVKVQNGFELGELHDVYNGAKTTPVANDALLLRDSADSNLWKRLTWTNALAGVKSHIDTFKSVANGYASLDASGKVPASELPSYVDDVVEVENYAALPGTGETGKIYVTLDNNKCYRWSGTVYIQVAQGVDTLTTTGTSGAATLVGSTLNIPQYQGVLTNPVTGTGTAGQVAYFNGTSAVTGSQDFIWNDTTKIISLSNAGTLINEIRVGSINSNTVMGRLAGSSASLTGGSNSFYGRGSGQFTTTGLQNSFFGSLAGQSNTTGSNNSFFGYQSGRSTTTGSSNSFFGIQSGLNVTTGSNNSFFGSLAGRYIADGSTSLTVTNNSVFLGFDTRADADSQTNQIVIGYQAIGLGSNTTVIGNSSTTQTWLGGNLTLGTTTSGGRLTVRGSGTTSATTALLVQNSTPSDLFGVRDDGLISLANNCAFLPTGTGAADNRLQIFGGTGGAVGTTPLITLRTNNNITSTSGSPVLVQIQNGFTPTSGTATFSLNVINPTINQTGGANGITRGLYVNPTLTAAADWRSIETSNNTGWGIYGAGTANNYLGGSLGIGTTSLTGYNLRVDKQITGLTTSTGIASIGTIQSDVTTNARMFTTFANTQATTFTLTNLYHYQAQQGNIGLNSVVTNQFGFAAEFNITGATNNYGFYGNIASGTGRWNLYMNGTAANYLAGNTSIGTTTSSGRLTVRGSGTTSASNGLLVEDSGGTDTFTIRDDGGFAFKGGTVGVAQTGYTTFTNLTTDRTCNANATTVEELADILGTLIEDLKTKGIISA